MLVGIDYSINSPALCIETTKDGKPFYNYITVQKKDNKCNRKLNMLNDVQVIVLEKEDATDFEFIDKQTDYLIQCIEGIMALHKETELIIGIEDFIYYSQQNSLIDIVQATTILKYKIIKKWGEGVLNKYSPTHIKKKATGNGRADKNQMLIAFNKLNLINPFALFCKTLNKAIPPVHDCIDAFFVLKTLKDECYERDLETL